MDTQQKLVILTAGFGDSHSRIACSLQAAFSELGQPELRIVDLFHDAHPGFNAVTTYLYARSPVFSAVGLDYYGWSYKLTRNMERDSKLAQWLSLLGKSRLKQLVEQEKPAAIIVTFPFAGLKGIMQQLGVDIPVFTLITDLSLHNRWLLTDAKRYYVATKQVCSQLIAQGVSSKRIQVTGIPVAPEYTSHRRKQQGLKERAPRSLKAIVIVAGMHCLYSDLRNMIEPLLLREDARIEVICGANTALKQELEHCYADEWRLEMFGYVDTMYERMRHASLIIAKAGSNTLFEAMHLRLPIIIFKPRRGHQQENAQYMEEAGAALIAHNVRQLAAHASAILDDPEPAARLLSRYEAILPPNTARDAATHIALDILGQLPLPVQSPASLVKAEEQHLLRA